LNANSTTGDFSFGISGFLFEDGQIVKPVNEMYIWKCKKLLGQANQTWERFLPYCTKTLFSVVHNPN